MNSLALLAAEKSLEKQSFIDKTLTVVKEGRNYLYQVCHTYNLKYIESFANFVYIDLPFSARDFYEFCLSKGVIIRPLTSFGCPNSIRVSIGRIDELQYFEDVLKEGLQVCR